MAVINGGGSQVRAPAVMPRTVRVMVALAAVMSMPVALNVGWR
jgi:hypothetical protein